MFGHAGDAMPHIGRSEPELKGQYAIHLTKVRDGQARLRFAIWISTKQKWVTYACKDHALERSIKANGDAPDWQPPSEFYLEGYTLSSDKENVPVSQRTAGTGNWCDLGCDSSSRHPSRRSRKTKSTGSSSGASSASSGPPSDPAERKVYERSQKMKKSQKKRDARSRSKMASLITTGFAQSEEKIDSRAAEVRRAIETSRDVVRGAIETSRDVVREDVERVREATKEVLAKVIKGSREAAEARLEAEEQRLTDQEAAADKAAEEAKAKLEEAKAAEEAKQAKAKAKLEEAKAKLEAKKVLLKETQAREKAEKAGCEATAEAHNAALVAAIKEVGEAVEGKVVEAMTDVKKVVSTTAEAAVLAADAAVAGASASKDAKEAVEAFKYDFAGTIEALLRKHRTMDEVISISEETELKEGFARLQAEVARLGQQRSAVGQRNAAGPRAGSVLVRNPAPAPAPAPAPSTRSGATRSGATRSGATRNGAAAATRNGAAAATTARKQAAPPRERLPVLKGEFGKLVRQDVATLSDGKKGEDGAWKVKINILASVPQLLLQAQQEDQLLATLAALVKGITTVLEPKAANENQLIAAALAAIYAIYNSLEANSNEMELVAATLVPSLLKATDKKVQGARQASTQFGKAVVALVGLAAPSERVLEAMLPRLYAKELTGDNECLWTANALGSYVRATPQQVEPPTPEMYGVSQGLLHLLGHKSDQVRDAAISSVCDLAKVNKGLAISLAETKHMNKQLAEKLGKAVKAATAHYTAVELGSPLSS